MNGRIVTALSAGPLFVYGACMLIAPDATIAWTKAGFNAAGSLAGLPWQVWMVFQLYI